jgi:AcrR family transcriptional regulator
MIIRSRRRIHMTEKDIRIPKRKRSMEKKQKIKDAAIRLMSEQGYHKTSSNEIAKEAGVSIGTFYSYFKDKKELYKELVADIYNVVLSPIDLEELPADVPVRDTVYLYISTVFRGHEYETAFQREIASLSEQSDEFREIEMQYKANLTLLFSNILGQYREELRTEDLKTASYLILTAVEAVVHDTTFHNGGKNKKAVIEELTDMIVRYLFRENF